jgi:hypothetical protein
MTDPVTTAIATALATKAVNGLTEAGRAAFVALMRLVRRKLSANTHTGVLNEAEAHPTSDTRRRDLADALTHAMVDDPSFSEQLVNLWRQVQESRSGTVQGSVVNIVSGDVDGKLLQARDIHGNVSFK